MFKKAVLEEIRDLFWWAGQNPMYCGLGNKESDEQSYLFVGIPRERIFIVDK